jgi:hypothetical protein
MVEPTIAASAGFVAIWPTKERSIFTSPTGSVFKCVSDE